jgi:hypothetical protein
VTIIYANALPYTLSKTCDRRSPASCWRYLRQRLDRNGWQQEEYRETDVGELPMELAIRANGEPVMVQITAWTGPIKARVWRLKVGRCDMAVTEVFGSPTGFCSGTDTKSWVY